MNSTPFKSCEKKGCSNAKITGRPYCSRHYYLNPGILGDTVK